MREIPLTQNQIALVDDEDYERLSAFSWSVNDAYASRGYHQDGKLVTEKMHHAIMGKPPRGFVVDHINGNTFDNRKCNLRFVTQQQNAFNTRKRQKKQGAYSSQFKGVHWRKNRRKWLARICVDGKRIYLGMFEDEQDAALAYNKAAKELHGEYAKLNKI